MPFVSEKQRAKFAELVKQGKMTQEKFDEWNNGTGNRKLPERSSSKVKTIKTTKLTKVIK